MKSIVHKDCRSIKYRMRVERSKKGKGSFKREKRIKFEE